MTGCFQGGQRWPCFKFPTAEGPTGHVVSMCLQSQSQLCPLTSASILPTPVKSESLLYVFWSQLKDFPKFLCGSFHLDFMCLPYIWHYLEPTQVYDSWSHTQIYNIGFTHSQWSHPRNTPWSPSFIRCKRVFHRQFTELISLCPISTGKDCLLSKCLASHRA